MNSLYSILIGDADISGASEWFKKRYYPVTLSKPAAQLRDKFVADIDTNKLPLFACCVSWLMLNTCFVKEILELDPNNTYVCPSRPEDAVGSDDSICSTAVFKPVEAYSGLLPFLDTDIISRTDTQSLPSVVGAISLQLLRGSK